MNEMKRGRLELIGDVMQVISHEGLARPIQIVYGANLSWANYRQLIGFLMKCGLIMEAYPMYKLTDTGEKFLQEYLGMLKRLED